MRSTGLGNRWCHQSACHRIPCAQHYLISGAIVLLAILPVLIYVIQKNQIWLKWNIWQNPTICRQIGTRKATTCTCNSHQLDTKAHTGRLHVIVLTCWFECSGAGRWYIVQQMLTKITPIKVMVPAHWLLTENCEKNNHDIIVGKLHSVDRDTLKTRSWEHFFKQQNTNTQKIYPEYLEWSGMANDKPRNNPRNINEIIFIYMTS